MAIGPLIRPRPRALTKIVIPDAVPAQSSILSRAGRAAIAGVAAGVKTKTPKQDKTIKVGTAPQNAPPRVSVLDHGLDVRYDGVSQPQNKTASKTRIPVEEFGSQPTLVLTPRMEAMLAALKREYGVAHFPRGNIDAGVLKSLGRKGVIVFVSGDPASADAKFRVR